MAASRACDPDICGTCGASIPPWFRTDVCTFIQQGLHQTNRLIEDYQDGDEELSDEGNRTKYSRSSSNGSSNHKQNLNKFPQNLCANLPFSHCRKALVYTGHSDIHGWGGFAGERIERGDFIMEYKGEVISQDEAERRGIIYDKHRSSYIFEANMCECIDATRKGNKSRFFNHVRDENANVMPKIMKIDGEHRIGLFAKTTIEPGQELTFNYGYSNLSAPDWAHQSTGTIGFHGWQSKRSKFQLSHKAKLKKNK
jgi:SET domain-containing protein